MIIFLNNNNTKFSQITLCIRRFTDKSDSFLLPRVYSWNWLSSKTDKHCVYKSVLTRKWLENYSRAKKVTRRTDVRPAATMVTTTEDDVLELCRTAVASTPIISPATGLRSSSLRENAAPAPPTRPADYASRSPHPPLSNTRSSAIAEGPRDASCQLKSCQLPRRNYLYDKSWTKYQLSLTDPCDKIVL